jgi:hypothetical protein
MKLKPAESRKATGGGWVLYGYDNRRDPPEWFERWYPSREKAEAFAKKYGWEIEQ